jgi:anhydro-N-acetylmuramic acid kinase
MSGTSADGIDAVVAEISGSGRGLKARLVAHWRQAFSKQLHDRVLRVCLHGAVAEICELNFILGEHFARAAFQVIRKAGLKAKDIAAIGSHGQTIHHLPNARTPSTLQIGEPAIIAERTGITTVADFRARDMAAGGQGAPLVPYADWVLFTDANRPRIIQNIGGIANLTFLPAAARLDHVVAFDTGPGNMVIDAVVSRLSGGQQTLDRNGKWAAGGKVSDALLKQLLAHPFIRKRPPKTTGREEFGESFVNRLCGKASKAGLSKFDLVATATAFTAASIADAYARFIFPKLEPKQFPRLEIVLGGGGAKNTVLRRMLAGCIAQRLEKAGSPSSTPRILTHEDFGIPNSAKEALAFAILAHETLFGRPGNVPTATAAHRAAVLGKIVPG